MTKTKQKLSPSIIKYLNIPDKNYSVDEIRLCLIKKMQLTNKIDKDIFHLDKDGKNIFNTSSPTIRISVALTYIFQRYVINTNKPSCDFYEYNQLPVTVVSL
jgi:hypothetical protein